MKKWKSLVILDILVILLKKWKNLVVVDIFDDIEEIENSHHIVLCD